ncbi:uncharacterized protein TRIADDRAFT_55740 [Trichoplax adhaerens]|uniref:Nose resistant-to-fluoxetine protein N-terminal domain-containing protein n=1 Tax=Trichoplax adhaerens TaxID=10228 RepID=B3RVQ7_TRIAD|nr:hypothetical protein TRIADDRAFT_55740 [Trichoplax adhaerens]EDV25543.1 hypothetical protein TRIADDRAFT_55740 [Trichoplax adhaerens]|eukprot:XP_002111576.1 hypothetical protein TRIADDRAFT_55740 [Trichoplax adhaerens]
MTPAQLIARYKSLHQPSVKPNLNSVSSQCLQSINDTFIKSSSSQDVTRIIDATGKIGAGILVGNLVWLGSYDECLSIKTTHYCTVAATIIDPKHNQSSVLRWGVCLPKGCNEQDIASSIEFLLDIFHIKTVKVYGSTVYCAHESPYTFGSIFTIVLCGILLVLVIVGTIIEACQMRKKDQRLHIYEDANTIKPIINEDTPLVNTLSVEKENHLITELLLAFSVRKNSIAIFNTSSSAKNVLCLNGLRTISMFWVILGHTFLWPLITGNLENVVIGLEQLHFFTFQAVSNAFFCVDSFFFISGFLVSLLSLREMDKRGGKFPVITSYIHRFLRIVPTYMFVILIWTNVMPHLSSGPLWYVNQQGNACTSYWWTNLLFINNFWPTQLAKECIGWSWYLAADMQFFIISPAIIIPLHRFRRKALTIPFGLIMISVGISAALAAVYRFDASLIANTISGGHRDPTDVMYVKPYCRIQPYLVGMMLGYLIYEKNFQSSKISMIKLVLGWVLSISLGLACVYGLKNELNRFWTVVYLATSRLGWSVSLCWVVYVCQNGYGVFANTVLSWKFWIPLGRLTFTAYLLHPIVLQVFYSGYRSGLYFSTELIVYLFASMVTLSYLAAYGVSVCVEYPFANLEKIIFDRVLKINRRGS